ncbi:MAG: Hsp70 family protein [Vulcanimicrobiota bacterium]
MSRIVGIDLGTTNSEIALYENGKIYVIEEQSDPILPSVVGLSESGALLVGHQARNQWALYPERTVRSIKRKMGQAVKVTMGDKEFSPPEISALILAELKKRAERYLGEPVEKAVITVPAYFTDIQRKDTRSAGELAGLEVVRIINEPTAAALVYEPDRRGSQKILVYDLGGGTFDASLIQIEEGLVEVLASHGNNHLGGDDFDDALFEHFAAAFTKLHGVPLKDDRTAAARLLRSVEEARKNLSTHPFARVDEEALIKSRDRILNLAEEISRDDFEEMIMSYVEETIRAIQTTLKDAGITAGSLDRIILVGGATRTPLVTEMIEKEFGITPRHEISPDLAVAMGAAVEAALIEGHSVDRVLVDITPYTYGTSCINEMDGMWYPHCFAPIIKRNTPLPCSRSEVFYTAVDNQKAVDVTVYQGEHIDALKNILIGEFKMENLSSIPAGNEIVFHMDLDVNGILHVKAEEKRTGTKGTLTIRNAFQATPIVNLEEARSRLRLLQAPDEESGETLPYAENREEQHTDSHSPTIGSENRKEAESLIEKARKILGSVTDDDRDELINAQEEVRDALDSGDSEALDGAVENIKELLFYLA